MPSVEKAEFCSDAWLEKADAILKQLVAEYGQEIGSERRVSVKTYANPPAHLRQEGQDFVRWSFEIRDGKARVSRADPADAMVRNSAEYSSVAPIARIVLPTDAETLTRQREASLQRLSEEARRLDEATSPAMRRMLLEFHNRLALVTL